MESSQTQNLQKFQLFLIPRLNYLFLLFFTSFCFHVRSMTVNASFHQANKLSGLVLLQKASQQLLLAPLRMTLQRRSPKKNAQPVTAGSPIRFFQTIQPGPLFSSPLQGSHQQKFFIRKSSEIFPRVSREDNTLFYSSFCNHKSKIKHPHLFFLIWYHDWSYKWRTTNSFIWVLFL